MIVYSHIWDALLKVVSIVLLVITLVHWNIDGWLLWVSIAVWMILYRQFLTIVASWLYARLSLRTPVTFTEARALRKLFQLDLSLKWIPLRDIKKLPSDQRHDAVLKALGVAAPARKAMLL